jgi:hypothetical protein
LSYRFRQASIRKKKVGFVSWAAREPFIGLTPEKYPRYQDYVAAICAGVNAKPRIVEEHDGGPVFFRRSLRVPE